MAQQYVIRSFRVPSENLGRALIAIKFTSRYPRLGAFVDSQRPELSDRAAFQPLAGEAVATSAGRVQKIRGAA